MTVNSQELTLEQKVGQLFFIGIPGPSIDAFASDLLTDISPGGVCLFARNIRDASQTRELNDEISSLLPVKPFLSIDQEGGLVDRLRRIMTPMPAAGRIRTRDDARELALIVADALTLLGFNMDFAPVVDVIDATRAGYTNGLFSREFGRSREDVAGLAGEFLRTLQSEGILGCVKHFPGLGASRVDSHEELPQVDISEAEIDEIDLFPYIKLSDEIHAVMVAHAAYPTLSLQERDQNGKLLPSSLSNNFVNVLLRRRLGFDGLVITDDLEMGAILKNYGIGDACRMAVKAGADMLAICADPQAIRDGFAAVRSAVHTGEISGERLDASVRRIAALRSKAAPSSPFDAGRVTEISAKVRSLDARLA